MPKPPEDANQQSSDGFLVNGSVNNAATSQFSSESGLRQSPLQHQEPLQRRLRPHSRQLSARCAALFAQRICDAQAVYDRITLGFTMGGPIKDSACASPRTKLLCRLPMDAQPYRTNRFRAGPHARGDGPARSTATTFPVSPQAQALLQLYPLPNITGNPPITSRFPC